MTVWADTHKMVIDNLGSGKMCLSNIGSPGIKYEDIEFQDPITKAVTKYQARVYKGSVRLDSAFWPSSNNVHCNIWFQQDLPYPGVDLTKLRPKKSDSYPLTLIDFLKYDMNGN